MSWLKKLLPRIHTAAKKGVPEGLWSKCLGCSAILYAAELEKNLNVCPKCNYHMAMPARKRLEYFFDEKSTQELATEIKAEDPLRFRDTKRYKERILAAQKLTHEKEAFVVMNGLLKGQPVVAGSFEFAFIGGSMSSGVGARFVAGVNYAIKQNLPWVCFSTSGGARMQEGLISLFQMAKTSTALAKLAEKKLPFISVLTDPTMGGVSASLANLGDIIIAEPKALIGFSGPRVIQQTIRETLPEGFQRSEFLLEHGAIDMIVDRRELRDRIAELLSKLMGAR